MSAWTRASRQAPPVISSMGAPCRIIGVDEGAQITLAGRHNPQVAVEKKEGGGCGMHDGRTPSDRGGIADPRKRSRLKEVRDGGKELSAGGYAKLAVGVLHVGAQRLERYPESLSYGGSLGPAHHHLDDPDLRARELSHLGKNRQIRPLALRPQDHGQDEAAWTWKCACPHHPGLAPELRLARCTAELARQGADFGQQPRIEPPLFARVIRAVRGEWKPPARQSRGDGARPDHLSMRRGEKPWPWVSVEPGQKPARRLFGPDRA